jgi:heme/copper-type cytochrome/quinol oxidase subunit 4
LVTISNITEEKQGRQSSRREQGTTDDYLVGLAEMLSLTVVAAVAEEGALPLWTIHHQRFLS